MSGRKEAIVDLDLAIDPDLTGDLDLVLEDPSGIDDLDDAFKGESAAQKSRRFVKRSAKKKAEMTIEEEMVLVAKAQSGCRRSIAELIEKNKPYILAMARKMNRYSSSSADKEDLYQEGLMGLTKALQKFDVKLKFRFLTYANWWVQAAMYDWAFKNSRIVKHTMASEIRRVSAGLPGVVKSLGIDIEDVAANAEKIAEKLKCKIEHVEIAAVYWQKDVSTTIYTEDGDSQSYDTFGASGDCPFSNERSLIKRILLTKASAFIHEAADRIQGDKHRAIFKERFLQNSPRTLIEIGNDFSLTRERIRQIESEAHQNFLRIFKSIVAANGIDIREFQGMEENI